MFCHSLLIRGSIDGKFWKASSGEDLPDIERERVKIITEKFNRNHTKSFFFLSYWGRHRTRINAVSEEPLSEEDFRAFARDLELDIEGHSILLSETTPDELMKKAGFARNYGFLDRDTDVFEGYDIYDLRFLKSRERRRKRNGYIQIH